MKTAFLILISIGCLIVEVAGLFQKKYPKEINKNHKAVLEYPEDTTDPLRILREDTFSNEETNEMTGYQIREQHKTNNL